MSLTWEHLEPSIKVPKDETYRERLKSVLCDNKLHFFALKGVDPTNDNWHETLLEGTVLTVYDLGANKWLATKNIAALDKDTCHREHLFSVAKHVLAFVYAAKGGYYKLFGLGENSWNQAYKIDNQCAEESGCCVKEAATHDLHHRFFPTPDGFYVAWEADKVYVARFKVEVDTSGDIKGAQCQVVAQFDIRHYFSMGSHLTGLAFAPDHKKLFLWGGQQGCGFHWEPTRIFAAQLQDGKVAEAQQVPDKPPEAVPTYAFSGPQKSLQIGNLWVMLGGSTAVGMSQCKDNKEIWCFDVTTNHFKKVTKLALPEKVVLHRTSFAYDYVKGDVFVCDREEGIFKSNLKNLIDVKL